MEINNKQIYSDKTVYFLYLGYEACFQILFHF